jgi:hypothetical protein
MTSTASRRPSGGICGAEGKSDRTAVIYLQAVRFFARWCRDQGDDPTVEATAQSGLFRGEGRGVVGHTPNT